MSAVTGPVTEGLIVRHRCGTIDYNIQCWITVRLARHGGTVNCRLTWQTFRLKHIAPVAHRTYLKSEYFDAAEAVHAWSGQARHHRIETYSYAPLLSGTGMRLLGSQALASIVYAEELA